MKQLHSIVIMLLIAVSSIAQEKLPVLAPYNSQNMRDCYLDTSNQHTALKNIIHIDSSTLYTLRDSSKRSLLHRKLFKEHLLEFRQPDYNVFIDFLPDFQLGRSSNGRNTWLNTRGARVQANIGNNLYFESYFYENQGVFPVYIDSFVAKRRIVPGQGEAKRNIKRVFDFAYVNALLSYTPNKFLNLTMGYGTNSFGDGYRSMLLSDFSFSYPYLRITGTLGRIQYTSMWAQFIDLADHTFGEAYDGIGYPKKWGVFHFLDWKVSRKLTIGLYEAVIWPDTDTAGRKRGFDWSYMNPIIFLRPAEFSSGSSDNSLLGLNIKYELYPNIITYGQFLLDEFKMKEVLKGNGWWGNKWSTQIGFRTFNTFKVPRLDMQAELNIARPFTYSYSNTRANYAHYNQSLAHPMGANFHEVLGIVSYTYKRWFAQCQINYANYGLDYDSEISYGQDIFKSYTNRINEYGNTIGQGLNTEFLYSKGTLAYILNPKYNLRLEISAAKRHETNIQSTKNEFIFSIGLRSSFRQLYYDF